MIRYVPFLKAKRGEFNALGQLDSDIRNAVCPFFDFPRKSPIYDSESFAKTASACARSLQRHYGVEAEFYFDDLDVDQTLEVKGKQQYAFILGELKGLRAIPVMSLDRTSHNAAVNQLRQNGIIGAECVAFRVFPEEFEDYQSIRTELVAELADVVRKFDRIDLVFDCRLCVTLDATAIAVQIADFTRKFSEDFPAVGRVIVTGSSIPASLGDIVSPNSTEVVARCELAIIAAAKRLAHLRVIPGDYGIVSPYYSDAAIEPWLFQTITAPKLIYSFDHSHHIARGGSLKSGGPDQYVGLTAELCGKSYFRGRGYSKGEDYFDDKRRRIGKNATNGSVVTPSVVSHITYVVRRSDS